MTDDLEGRSTLERLRREGRVSESEQEALKLLLGEHARAPETPREPESQESQELEGVQDRRASVVFFGALIATSAVLILSASFGFIAWPAAGVGVTTLLVTLVPRSRWLALVGLLVSVVVGVATLPQGAGEPEAVIATNTNQKAAAVVEPPTGSLGVRLGELSTKWNGIDQPPSIDRGVIKSLESGVLDGFYHHFGGDVTLAGAYDPADDFIYALAASAPVADERARNLYLHLCYVLHPYSQDCIDGYFEDGLGGDDPAELAITGYESSWNLGNEDWHLRISAGVLTLRVLGDNPDQR